MIEKKDKGIHDRTHLPFWCVLQELNNWRVKLLQNSSAVTVHTRNNLTRGCRYSLHEESLHHSLKTNDNPRGDPYITIIWWGENSNAIFLYFLFCELWSLWYKNSFTKDRKKVKWSSCGRCLVGWKWLRRFFQNFNLLVTTFSIILFQLAHHYDSVRKTELDIDVDKKEQFQY